MAQETLLQCRTESNHTVGKRCAGSVAKYRSVTPILNLPFEILEKICGFITDTDDLIELIHTCRRLCVVLKPDGKHWTLMIKRMWGNALPRWFIPSKVIKPGWTHSTQRGLSVVFEKVVQHECFEFFDYSIKVFRSLCKQLCYNSLYQLCRDWTMNSCYVCLHDERCLAPGKVLLKREITGKKRQLMLCVPHARATIPLGTIRDKYGLKPVDVDHLQDASIPQRSRRLQQPCYFTDNVLNRCIEVYGNLSVCGHTKDARYRQMRARAIMDSLYRAGMLVHPGQKMHESVEVHNHYGYNTYSRDEFVFPSGYGPQALEPEVYDTDSESARSLAGDGVRIKSCTDNGVDEHPKVAKGKLRFTGVEFVPRMGIQNLAENTESKHMNVRADADLARTTEEGQTKVRKGRKRDPAVCKQMEKLEFISVGMQTGTDKVTTDMSTQPSNSTEMSSVPTVGQSIRRDRRANKQQLAADSHCAHGNGVEVVLESNTACEQITIPRLATAKCTDPPCVHRNDKEPFSESNAMTDGTQSLAARSLSTLSSRARRPSNWEKDTSQCTTGIRKTRRVLLPTPRRHSMPATTGAMCARTFQMTIPDWRIEPQTVALKKSDWLSRAWGPVTESVIAPLEVCSGRVPSVHPSRYPDACRKFSLDTGSRFWAKEKDVVRGLQATEAVDTPISGYTPARKIVELPANENLSAIGDPSDSRGCISGVGAVDIATEPRASTGAIEGEGGAMLDTSRTGSGVYLCDMDIDNVRDKNFNINADPVREPYGTDVSSTSGDNVNVIPERKYKEANVIGAHASNEASGSAQMHENLPQVGFLSPEMRAADSKQEQCGSSPDDSVVVLSRRRNGVDIGKGRSTLHSHGIDVIVLSPKANVVENGSGGCGTSKLHDSGSSASSREKSTIESKDLVIGDIIAPTNNETIDSENGVIAMSPERRAADMDTGKCGMSASHARGLVVPSSEMRTGHTDKAKCGKIPPNSTKVCPKISFLPRSAFGPPTKEKAHKASVPGKQLARNADGTNDCSGDRGSHTCGLPHAQAWTTKGVGKASKSSYASASNGKVREHMRNLGMHNKRLDAQNGNADVQVDTPVPDLPQKPVRALAQSAWGKAPVFAAEKKTQAAKSVLTTPTTQSQVHGLENTRITSTETDGGGWGEAIAKQIVKNGFVDEPIRDYSEKLHAHTPEQGLVHTLTKQPQAHNLTSQSAHAPVGAQSTAHAPVGAQSTAHTHIQGVAHLHGHGHGSGLVSKPAVSMGRGRTGRGRGRRSTESQGPKLGPNSIWYTKFNVRLNPDVAEFSP